MAGWDVNIYISAWLLRCVFNLNSFAELVAAGIYQAVLVDDKPVSESGCLVLGVPLGTRSQSRYYLDEDGRQIAYVHYYLRPAGTIAASGQPDPKWVVFGRVRLLDASRSKRHPALYFKPGEAEVG